MASLAGASRPAGSRPSATQACKELRFFASYSDVDGQIRAAHDLAASTRHLLGPEPLLSGRAVELLVSLLQSSRADAQAAAAAALAAACRFEHIQTEWVAQRGVVPLTAVLVHGVPEAQLQACRAAEGVARHRDGREALAQVGAVRALLRIARDEHHQAQDAAAAALAKAVGIEAATPRSAPKPKPGSSSRRGATSRAVAQKMAARGGKACSAAGPSSAAATPGPPTREPPTPYQPTPHQPSRSGGSQPASHPPGRRMRQSACSRTSS